MALGLDQVYPEQGDYAFHWRKRPDGSYTAEGSYGQLVILVPDLKIAVATTAGTARSEEEYDIISRSLIQPLRTAQKSSRAESFSAELQKLSRSLSRRAASLNLLENPVMTSSPMTELIDGKTFKAEKNADNITSIAFTTEPEAVEFTMADHRGTYKIRSGVGQWLCGISTMTGNYLHHQYQNSKERYAAYAKWLDARHLRLS